MSQVCLRLLVLLCLAICCSGKVPEVFEDYFNQDVQVGLSLFKMFLIWLLQSFSLCSLNCMSFSHE